MDYCNKCSKRECEYIEVKMFLQYISEYLEKDFEICECPDKAKLDYTCDMVLIDAATGEKIYVEIKEVKYGFGNEKDKSIAEENGQLSYAGLISEVIAQSDINKEIELNEFMITIPRTQIGRKNVESFCAEFKEFINVTTFKEDEYTFVYKRNGNDIKIVFSRKTDETIQNFGDELLFAYDTEENSTIESIFKKVTDEDILKEKIIYNLKSTSQKKFPNEADRKILLNILRLPLGYDIFFNMNIKYMIGNLMSESFEFISDANESYLLYFCEEYDDVTKTNDRPLIEKKGKVLFIIPLISEWMQETIGYQLS